MTTAVLGLLDIARVIFNTGVGDVVVAKMDEVSPAGMASLLGSDADVCIVGPITDLSVLDHVDPAFVYKLDRGDDRFVLTNGDARKMGAVPLLPDVRLVKRATNDGEEERFVLGVVLEPNTEDSQGDIYDEEEVRKAAHWYMEHGRKVGLQHRKDVSDKITVIESYIMPTDTEVGGQMIKKGTWMMAVRVNDDDIWEAVKSGDLTGFSIGGSALRLAA